MFSGFRKLLGGKPAAPPPAPGRHQKADHWPAAIYAIGDIHGCRAELDLLHARIFADAAAIDGDKWLVYLGDYVDRGPNSAGVLDALLAPLPKDFRRFTLSGNHEAVMLDFLAAPSIEHGWMSFGGIETLASYGMEARSLAGVPAPERIGLLKQYIPQAHLDLLDNLAFTLSLPGVVFVHAGLRMGVPIALQQERDLLWIRQEFYDAPPEPGLLVVHGHTPAAEPVVTPSRICVDTGAFATGVLTAVRLLPDGDRKFIATKDLDWTSAGRG